MFKLLTNRNIALIYSVIISSQEKAQGTRLALRQLLHVVAYAIYSHYAGEIFMQTLKPIWYSMNTYLICDSPLWRSTRRLRYRNHAESTVLKCEPKPYLVWFSCQL